ncbi:hypothetical protein F4810DRAFT_110022 [Camillea tinctor]|nr:hypothetical protein F4810DRAFT_110022 [Camillea tinctor]
MKFLVLFLSYPLTVFLLLRSLFFVLSTLHRVVFTSCYVTESHDDRKGKGEKEKRVLPYRACFILGSPTAKLIAVVAVIC